MFVHHVHVDEMKIRRDPCFGQKIEGVDLIAVSTWMEHILRWRDWVDGFEKGNKSIGSNFGDE